VTTAGGKTMPAIVIDGRKLSEAQIRAKAQKQLNQPSLEEDLGGGPGDHGFILHGDRLFYYHVASVKRGFYVASTNEMSPSQTRPLVKAYLKERKIR